MRNPARSEAAAFRFLLLTIGYFALIVIASAIGTWVGVGVFVVLTAGVLYLLFGRREQEVPEQEVPAASPEGEHRILVVANETVGGAELRSELAQRAGRDRVKVLVVCPALNSPLRHWVSDEDEARDAAQERLERSLESLRAVGVDATGEIGDGDPLQAIEDAVRTFRPDALIISTHPEGRSHWLERGVVERARSRFRIELTHIVVDLPASDS